MHTHTQMCISHTLTHTYTWQELSSAPRVGKQQALGAGPGPGMQDSREGRSEWSQSPPPRSHALALSLCCPGAAPGAVSKGGPVWTSCPGARSSWCPLPFKLLPAKMTGPPHRPGPPLLHQPAPGKKLKDGNSGDRHKSPASGSQRRAMPRATPSKDESPVPGSFAGQAPRWAHELLVDFHWVPHPVLSEQSRPGGQVWALGRLPGRDYQPLTSSVTQASARCDQDEGS